MTKSKTSRRNKRIKELILPAKGFAVLRTTLRPGKNSYSFYDIQYGNVIITGCRVVGSRNGAFLAMPSREGSDGEYYPVVYLSHELGDKFMDWIETADEEEEWEEVEEDFYLRHIEDEDEKPKKNKKKRKAVVESDEDEDDEEEDDEEEDEEEKPKKKAAGKKKAAADDDYPF
jgi:DNA-binding cell septation regulator SpoVG